MSASRTSAASPSTSSAWWRSITLAMDLRQAPPAGEHAADQRVVDAELAALGLDPLLGGARLGVDLTRVAGIRVDEDELADVVQQRGDHQPVAGLVAELASEPVGGALRGDGVQAEALGDALPHRGALEEVERPRLAGDRVDVAGRQHLDALDRALDAALRLAVDAVGEAQHGDREGHVGLDGGDDVGGRRLAVLEQAQDPIARLGEHREGFQRLEGGGQPAAVALVVMALARGVRIS